MISLFLLSIWLTMAAASPVFRNAEAGEKLMSGNAQFAWNLFQKLSADKPSDNLFYSPASISIALGMTSVGARSQTKQQMRETLGFGDITEEEVHPTFEDLHSALHNTGGNYTLHTANRLFAEQTYTFLQPFLEATKTHYKAELAPVDFRTKYEEARIEINKWVESQTNDKIKDLLAEGVLDALTRMVLVNAIYFKGNWEEQFDPKSTKDGEFQVTASNKVPVKMMYQEKKFKYGYDKDIGAKVLELPYVSKKLSMFLVLPEKHHGLAEVEAKLTSQQLHEFEKTFHMFSSKTQVTIPRFKFEQSFDLGGTLAALGMSDLFNPGKADLSGMDGTNNLFVSKVIHKAFIEVNEEGSEAAAATAVKVGLRSMPRIMEFYANQPFLFFIRENASKSILFFGRVNNPGSNGSKDEL